MATVERSTSIDDQTLIDCAPDDCDPEGFPLLENGERMDQKTFHERYLRTSAGFSAELIGGKVYIMASPLKNKHARNDARASAWLFHYSMETPGAEVQDNATTILDDTSEPQPDSALLIMPEYGGQTHDGDDDFTYGAPELIVEVALSSRSIDLGEKFQDYERAGVREYIVFQLREKSVQWFTRSEGRLQPLAAGPDGLFHSQVFPGLWLDADALFRNDKRALIAGLKKGLEAPEHADFVTALEQRRLALLKKP